MRVGTAIATFSLCIGRAALAQTPATPATPAPAVPAASEAQPSPGPEAIGAFFVGPGLFELTPLNDRLRSNGYETIPSLMTLVGAEGHLILPSGLVFGAHGAGLLSPSGSGPMDMQTQFGGGFGLLDLGYAFVHSAPILASFYAGFGGYGTSFEISSGQAQKFDAVLQNPQQSSSMGRSGLLIGATLALDGRIPLGSADRPRRSFVSIGVRVSGLVGSGLGGWTLSHGADATDGPVLGLNGGFVALAIGFGSSSRRRF